MITNKRSSRRRTCAARKAKLYNDSLERKPAVSRGKASCGAGFRLKRGSRGKNTEQGFAAVIVFVPRERVVFFDTLKPKRSFLFGFFFIRNNILTENTADVLAFFLIEMIEIY